MVDIASAAAYTGTTAAATASETSATKLATDFSDFLTLLTTQLQHQDPMDPLDSNEFTNQLVSFTGVEQQIRTNQNLESMASLMMLGNVGSAVNYIGKQALIPTALGDHDGATGISWQYQNTIATDQLTIEVKNADGDVVYSQEGETALGLHKFNWDGTMNGGTMAPEGTYKLSITALNEDGDALDPAIAVEETVTAVDMSGLEPIFTIGPNDVGQSRILQILGEK